MNWNRQHGMKVYQYDSRVCYTYTWTRELGGRRAAGCRPHLMWHLVAERAGNLYRSQNCCSLSRTFQTSGNQLNGKPCLNLFWYKLASGKSNKPQSFLPFLQSPEWVLTAVICETNHLSFGGVLLKLIARQKSAGQILTHIAPACVAFLDHCWLYNISLKLMLRHAQKVQN